MAAVAQIPVHAAVAQYGTNMIRRRYGDIYPISDAESQLIECGAKCGVAAGTIGLGT